MEFKCPECGYPQYCPCKICQRNIPKGIKPWVTGQFKKDRLVIPCTKCANCGFTQSYDWWADEELKQIKSSKKRKET